MTSQETTHIIWLFVQMLAIAIYFAYQIVDTVYIHLHEDKTGLLPEHPTAYINGFLCSLIGWSIYNDLGRISLFQQYDNEDWLFLIKPAVSLSIMFVLFWGCRLFIHVFVRIFKSKFEARVSNNTETATPQAQS